jgi:hypothetical protein
MRCFGTREANRSPQAAGSRQSGGHMKPNPKIRSRCVCAGGVRTPYGTCDKHMARHRSVTWICMHPVLPHSNPVARRVAGYEVSELCGWCGSRPMSDASVVVVLCVGV